MTPTLFISHGAPNRFMGQSPAKLFLESLSEIVETPKAIIIFSAHWFSNEIEIALHDTYEAERFSEPLLSNTSHLNYQTIQPQWFIDQIVSVLQENNLKYSTSRRALDHGAWSVLKLSYPKSDIPVIGMSLPIYNNLDQYFDLGKKLKVLRKENILIIGSGSATHNLTTLSNSGEPPSWAVEFVTWLQDRVKNNDYSALTNLYQSHQTSRMAHPTPDHYIPLLIAAGATVDESNEIIHDSYEYGSLNNTCIKFGNST